MLNAWQRGAAVAGSTEIRWIDRLLLANTDPMPPQQPPPPYAQKTWDEK